MTDNQDKNEELGINPCKNDPIAATGLAKSRLNLIQNSPYLSAEEKRQKCIKGAIASQAIQKQNKILRKIAYQKCQEIRADGKTNYELVVDSIIEGAIACKPFAVNKFFSLIGLKLSKFEETHTDEEIEAIKSAPIDPLILKECIRMGLTEEYLQDLKTNNLSQFLNVISRFYEFAQKDIQVHHTYSIMGLDERVKRILADNSP